MSIGREDYAERKEARIDRLESRAARAQTESAAAYNTACSIMDHIPPRQLILVGHHSEKRHRRDLDKIDRNMRKSAEADERAGYYASRAEAAASNTAISSDDPDALEKLEAKLARLQVAQEEDKALNAYYRKHKTVKGFPGIRDDEAARADRKLSEMREAIRRPVPSWQLSNRNSEIARLKKRIESLRQVDKMEHVEIEFDGGMIVTNEEINRVQIIFDAKPDEAIRCELKSWGFRWSPREGAWLAQRTPVYLHRAKRIPSPRKSRTNTFSKRCRMNYPPCLTMHSRHIADLLPMAIPGQDLTDSSPGSSLPALGSQLTGRPFSNGS